MLNAVAFLKPEYLFRPAQAARRLWRAGARENLPLRASVRVPWGHRLECSPRESIGHALWHLGVYELALTETIFRLLEPGELACDVGANLGYMTSVMSFCAGPRGRVLAYEPHPEIFARLERNARASGPAPIETSSLALSDHAGKAVLYVPTGIDDNAGLSSLIQPEGREGRGAQLSIELTRWDDQPAARSLVGLMKIDTEGAELQVLHGARASLAAGRIRDILFEDHWTGAGLSPVASFLTGVGYSVFRVDRGFWAPVLVDPNANRGSRWEPANFLATRDAKRALQRLRGAGWSALRGKPYSNRLRN